MSDRGDSIPSTVVLGMGNLILSDDGLGVRALQLLEGDSRVPQGVRLVDAGTFGLELLGYVAGVSRLLVLDCVDVGEAPGTLVRLDAEELRKLPFASHAHDLSLTDLLAALRLMGMEPKEVLLMGIQPATTDPGTALSPSVEAVLPKLVGIAIQELVNGATKV
jgi:hydrogenase maturation protease